MEPLTCIEAPAAPLLRENIDTDALFPAAWAWDFETDYAAALFANWRYLDGRSIEDPDFVLNRNGYRGARILIAGGNFGCGSSREHAVWALAAFGIRVVIAVSFAEIFRGNAIANGVLPVSLPRASVEALARAARAHPGAPFRVDLVRGSIRDCEGNGVAFAIEAAARERLLAGVDDIDIACARIAAIERFEAARPPGRH